MALKGFDGFDHYGAGVDPYDLFARSGAFIQYVGGTTEIVRPGRNGYGGAVQATGIFSTEFAVSFKDRNATAIIGQAIKLQGVGGDFAVRFLDSVANAYQFTVVFKGSNGTISVYKGSEIGGTLLYLSANNLWVSDGSYFYYEFKVGSLSHSATLTIQINGAEVMTASGLDLQSSANAWFDQVRYCAPFDGFTWMYIDDLYYCDSVLGDGTYPCNDFIGDVRVATLFALGNDQVAFSPSPNTNANWQNISELSMDSDVTYNFTATVGAEDRFNFDALPNVISAIMGVQLVVAGRKDDAGLREIKQALKTHGSIYYGTSWSLPDTAYAYFVDLWILNPSTLLNFTNVEVNALAAGYNEAA